MDVPTEKHARQEFWLAHVQAWQQSGLTQRAYCRQHNLKSADVLGYWIHRDKRRQPPTLTLVPAQVPASAHSSADIRLTSPLGWQLALPAHVAPQWIAQLLQQLP